MHTHHSIIVEYLRHDESSTIEFVFSPLSWTLLRSVPLLACKLHIKWATATTTTTQKTPPVSPAIVKHTLNHVLYMSVFVAILCLCMNFGACFKGCDYFHSRCRLTFWTGLFGKIDEKQRRRHRHRHTYIKPKLNMYLTIKIHEYNFALSFSISNFVGLNFS